MDGATIVKYFGTADNSHEPEPLVNRQSTILGIVITFKAFSTLCGLFRLYTRARVVRSLGWDDFFIVMALCSTTVGSVGVCVSTKYGLGRHLYTLTADEVYKYLRTFYVANASYQTSTAFIKISLLFQYLRIFENPSFLRRLCIGTIIFTSVWASCYATLGWIPCIPVNAYWDWTIPAKRWAYGSLDANVFAATYESHAAVNVVLDLLVLAIPVPLYFRRDVALKSRLGLLGLLTIGLVYFFPPIAFSVTYDRADQRYSVNAVSIVRLISLVQHRSATRPTLDFPWYAPISIVLTCVEIDLATVASCIPIFWPVLRRFPGIFVTKEVEVTREVRRLESVELEDDIELETDRRSRVGSEASLRQEAVKVNAGKRYLDEFVAGHVDPLRRSKSVVTEIKSGDTNHTWWPKDR
ncbi:hypothetical protein CCHL11_02727 [Colletotrichum chlorophyti]|uniref:Rhodopsin domain-containing protein n=1 Tax=Colletotrichum chlorophyti TaxID=708187 RepID=A0A1Q8S2V7_9PEZI|nr:hypothetical protein CCHL11_02727 [Colletotrichum chlorophyti]